MPVQPPSRSAAATSAATHTSARGEQDFVFATRTGAALDAANVRREFRAVCTAANLIGPKWTPRELRHSFVSLVSTFGVPVEESPASPDTPPPGPPRWSTGANYARS